VISIPCSASPGSAGVGADGLLREELVLSSVNRVGASWGWALALSCVLMSGCRFGGNPGRTVIVSGRVTLDGEPLSQASIQFTGLRTGTGFVADLDDDGAYRLQLLAVQPDDEFGVSFGPARQIDDESDVDSAGLPKANPVPSVPAKYLEFSSSGLTATIADAPEQSFDFELESQ
jgi:hypothetical protein